MNTFKKSEKLCSKILIDKLYKEGNSFLVYPLRVTFYFYESSSKYKVQVLFTVTKKRFKEAVKRNLIKRRMRESYRLYKTFLNSNFEVKRKNLIIAYNYIGNDIVEYDQINSSLKMSITNLTSIIEKQLQTQINNKI